MTNELDSKQEEEAGFIWLRPWITLDLNLEKVNLTDVGDALKSDITYAS